MFRKTLLAVLCFTAFAASAQFTISLTNRFVTGTVSGVDGSRVLLFDNRLTVDVAGATMRGGFGPVTLADLTPGTRITAGIVSATPDGVLMAVSVDVLPDHDASIEAQIERIDFAAGTLRIAGQTVRLTSGTEVLRTDDGALLSISDLRPLQRVLITLDRDESGLAAETIAITPMLVTSSTTGGTLSAVNGNLWTIGGGSRGTVVRVTDQTYIGGEPRIGERVRVTYRGDAAGDLVALTILRLSFIDEGDVVGEVQALGPNTITIDTGNGATTLRRDASTRYRGEPQIGDVVLAKRKDNAATSVELIHAIDNTFGFSGEVSMNGNEWTVAGVPFTVTRTTYLSGSFQPGDRVTVEVMDINGRWYAMTVDKLTFSL